MHWQSGMTLASLLSHSFAPQAQQQAQLTEVALADLRNRVATAEAKASSAKAGCCTIM